MRDLIQLLGYVLRISREIPRSRLSIIVVALMGIAGGLASTSMLALVNSIIGGRYPSMALVGGFAALCVALPVARYVSQLLLMNLSMRSFVELRLLLTRRVLRAPLRQLEAVGSPRLLATLTNDVGSIADLLLVIPVLLLHGSLVVSSFAYLCWLNWRLFLEVAVVTVLGVAAYQLAVRRALVHFRRSRQLVGRRDGPDPVDGGGDQGAQDERPAPRLVPAAGRRELLRRAAGNALRAEDLCRRVERGAGPLLRGRRSGGSRAAALPVGGHESPGRLRHRPLPAHGAARAPAQRVPRPVAHGRC